MVGIYKIVNPKGKIYIGQSIDIEKRFNSYKLLNCKKQAKLYNSLKKYGFYKHKFDIIIECELHELNELERYYQELYFCIGKNGLNLRLVNSDDRTGELSQESKNKIGNSHKGRKLSDEAKEKIRKANIGRKASENTKLKMSETSLKSIHIHKEKRKQGLLNYYKNNVSKYIGRKLPESTKSKIGLSNSKEIILDTSTGIFYFSYMEVSNAFGYVNSTIWRQLNNKTRNKTNLIRIT